MEPVKRTFLAAVLITLSLLAYVHQQTAILRISYSIGTKERELARLSEEYKQAKFRLSSLKSPQALSRRLAHTPLKLTSPKAREIIRVLKPIPAAPEVEAPVWFLRSPLLFWLNPIREAQARVHAEE
jgi:hypothetical protein